jgi:hypothetical protein
MNDETGAYFSMSIVAAPRGMLNVCMSRSFSRYGMRTLSMTYEMAEIVK